MKIQQSTTAYKIPFFMTQSADHVTGLTGASPTVTLSKNGGAFGAAAGAVTEISSGWYAVAGNSTDNNTLGPLALHATAASGDPTDTLHEVVAEDLTTATVAAVTTVTNLTNAPTAGDLTATQKASVTTAASAATPVATVSGDFSATMKTSIATAIFAYAFGAGYASKTFQQLFQKVCAALFGTTSGLGTVSEVFKSPVGATTEVTVVNDGTNRTTSTLA